MSILVPASEAEAAEIINTARIRQQPLSIEGGGTRRGLGRPSQTAATLSTKEMSGIVFHEPAEMVIRARAGTPVSEIERVLADKGQVLPFEPMDHRSIYGAQGEPTIGAVAACNISGPRRIRNGAARDSLIGVRFINGAGEIINSGGRVMKNVTGLDLVKLQCGAFGTLGLLSEVTFKVVPDTERTGTLVLQGLDDARAVEAMSLALGAPFEVSGAAYIPGPDSQVLLRIEHFAPSVEYRLGELEKLLAKFGRARQIDHDESRLLWRRIRDAEILQAGTEAALWRISIAPSRAPGMIESLHAAGVAHSYFFDWGGGLIWLALSGQNDAGASALRAALDGTSGHAMLVRASTDIRNTADVFQPQSEALMKITRGIKLSLDAQGVFNPGRMYAGV